MPIGFWSVILGAMCVISCGEKQKRSFNAFDTYLQFYQEVNDSLSKNPRYVCAEAQKRMTATTDSTTYYHYVMLLAKAYMFRSDMDSAAVCMNQAEAYCHRNAPTPQIVLCARKHRPGLSKCRAVLLSCLRSIDS